MTGWSTTEMRKAIGRTNLERGRMMKSLVLDMRPKLEISV